MKSFQNSKFTKEIILLYLLILNIVENRLLNDLDLLNVTFFEAQHSHSYPNYLEIEYKQNSNLADFSNELILNSNSKQIRKTTNVVANKIYQDCNSLFDNNCLCSFNQDIQRYFLYCNDQTIKKIPDFRQVYNLYNKHLKSKISNLVFAKLDFSGSSIKRIRKDDLKSIQFDFYNPKLSSNQTTLTTSPSNLNSNSFETFIDELKKSIIPMFHLDFDNIVEIDDGSFEHFVKQTLNLTYSLINKKSKLNLKNELLLKIRFNNSRFNFSPNRKPFKGLKAQEFHIDYYNTEYLSNSVFDETVISELYIDNAFSFIGFIDLGESLPSGKLLNRFIITRSYKIDSLCSHSLPSFIDQENFSEISIKKCTNLTSIKAFTFYRYRHLKNLILSYNSFSKIDKDSFRYLNQLEFLDLSFNPILTLEDETFRDLSSLKNLLLESTHIKLINENTFIGLTDLVELRLTKSNFLSEIHGRAFYDSRNSLKELHLKDTMVKLIDSFDQDGIEAPFLPELESYYNKTKKHVWLDGLNLNLLNLDSNTINEEFYLANLSKESKLKIMCKFLKYLSLNTLVNLQRNTSCNCLIYLLYRNKEYAIYPRWEFKAPFCYRTQIKFYDNGSKSFENIIKKENECHLNLIDSYCFPAPTTTTTTTTSTTTTTTTTTTSTTTRSTTTRNITKIRTTKYKELINPTTVKKKGGKFPKLDFKKLGKVVLTIGFITALSILLTILCLKISHEISKRKKILKLQNTRQRTSSNSSSNVTTLNNNLPRINSKTKINRLIMPPNVIPPFNKNLPTNINNSKKNLRQSTINQLVTSSIGSRYNQSENSALLVQPNTNEISFNINPRTTASFSIGSVND